MSSTIPSPSSNLLDMPVSGKSRWQRIREYWNLGVYGTADAKSSEAASLSQANATRGGEFPTFRPANHPRRKVVLSQPSSSFYQQIKGTSSPALTSIGDLRLPKQDMADTIATRREHEEAESQALLLPAALSLQPCDSKLNALPARVYGRIKGGLSRIAKAYQEAPQSPKRELIDAFSARLRSNKNRSTSGPTQERPGTQNVADVLFDVTDLEPAPSSASTASLPRVSRAPYPPPKATTAKKPETETPFCTVKPLGLPLPRSGPFQVRDVSYDISAAAAAVPQTPKLLSLTKSPSIMDFQCKGAPPSSSSLTSIKRPILLICDSCNSRSPLLTRSLCNKCSTTLRPQSPSPSPLLTHTSPSQVQADLFFSLPSAVWQEAESKDKSNGAELAKEEEEEGIETGGNEMETSLLGHGPLLEEESSKDEEGDVSQKRKWDVGSPWLKSGSDHEYRWSKYFRGWRERQKQNDEIEKGLGGTKKKIEKERAFTPLGLRREDVHPCRDLGKKKAGAQSSPEDEIEDASPGLESLERESCKDGKQAKVASTRTSSFYNFYDNLLQIGKD